jgi:hypothetical protein
MNPPLSVEIDIERRCAQVVYEAQPSFDQWQATVEAILQDTRFQSGFGILLDRSGIYGPASSDYMLRLVHFVIRNSKSNDVRWAIVTADLDSFGMGRMAEQLAQTGTIRTFKDRLAAELWLGGKGRLDSDRDGGEPTGENRPPPRTA